MITIVKPIIAKSYFIIPLFCLLFSCDNKTNGKVTSNARIDVRFGFKYYSICINDTGMTYVLKGYCSSYMDSLIARTTDTSKKYKTDSVGVFFKRLAYFKSNPFIHHGTYDAPRIEIYLADKKIYDAYKLDRVFWDLIEPIKQQIPKGYNPFMVSDKPFD